MPRISGKGANLWCDKRRERFVIYRAEGLVKRKTTVRFGVRSKAEARIIAEKLRDQLQACPSYLLANFRFYRESARQER